MIEFDGLLTTFFDLVPMIAATLITYAIHSSIIILCVLLITRAFPSLRPGFNDLLWKAALVGAIFTTAGQQLLDFEPLSGRHVFSQPQNTPDSQLAQAFSTAKTSPAPRFGFAEKTKIIEKNPQVAGSPKAIHMQREVRFSYDVSDDGSCELTDSILNLAGQRFPLMLTGPTIVDHIREPSGLLDFNFMVTSGIDSLVASGSLPFDHDQSMDSIQAMVFHGAEPTSGTQQLSWMHLLVLTWIAGLFISLGLYFRNHRALQRQIASRTALSDPGLQAMLIQLCAGSGITRSVKLTVSDTLLSPVALGGNEICVPQKAIDQLSQNQLRVMLAHEVAHLARRDPGWLKLSAAIDILFFFQPLSRFARTQLQRTAEYLCDDWAIKQVHRRTDLAKCLATVAGWIQQQKFAYVSGMGNGTKSDLQQRVQRILANDSKGESAIQRQWILVPIVFLALVLVFAPGISAELSQPNAYIYMMNTGDEGQQMLQKRWQGTLPIQQGTNGSHQYEIRIEQLQIWQRDDMATNDDA